MADDDTGTQPPASFTQDDVTAAATKAAKEAERRARQNVTQQIADDLGCTIEEAKAAIAAKAESDRANATDLDLARQAQAAAETKAAEAVAAAVKLTAERNAERALLAAKVQPAYLADALRLIDPASDDLTGDIAGLAERMPLLFTPDTDGTGTPPPPAPGFTPPRTPPPGGTGKTAAERAAERFKPQFTKSA